MGEWVGLFIVPNVMFLRRVGQAQFERRPTISVTYGSWWAGEDSFHPTNQEACSCRRLSSTN